MSYMATTPVVPVVAPSLEFLASTKLTANNRNIELTNFAVRAVYVLYLLLLTPTSASQQVHLILNGDTGANYSFMISRLQDGLGAVTGTQAGGATSMRVWQNEAFGGSPTGGTVLHGELTLMNLPNQTKLANWRLNNDTNSGPFVGQGTWSGAARISSIRIQQVQVADVFDAGAEVLLFGKDA